MISGAGAVSGLGEVEVEQVPHAVRRLGRRIGDVRKSGRHSH